MRRSSRPTRNTCSRPPWMTSSASRSRRSPSAGVRSFTWHPPSCPAAWRRGGVSCQLPCRPVALCVRGSRRAGQVLDEPVHFRPEGLPVLAGAVAGLLVVVVGGRRVGGPHVHGERAGLLTQVQQVLAEVAVLDVPPEALHGLLLEAPRAVAPGLTAGLVPPQVDLAGHL